MQHTLNPVIFLFLLILFSGFSSTAQKIYVSPNGKDKNPGTKEKPVATFGMAQILARKIPKDRSVTVIFERGTFYLPQPILFSDDDSKSNDATTTYSAEVEGETIISGGSNLELVWKPFGNGIFVASLPENTIIDQLYINGTRQRMARFPNAVSGKNVFDTWELNHNAIPDSTNNPLTTERIARWKNPAGGYIHAMHSALWGDMHWIIKNKNEDGTLNYEGG